MIRRMIVLGAALLAAVATTFAAAAPASADTVAVTYICGIPPFGAYPPATYDVTITAPATASRGHTVTLTASVVNRATMTESKDVGFYKATLRIDLGGASSGSVETTGLANPALQPGDLWQLRDGSAQVTLTNAGDVTFSPGSWRMAGFHCVTHFQQPVPVAATTRVR
jgi:hypothetical protein